MNRQIVDEYKRMYEVFLKNRTAPCGKEYDVIPSRRSGTTLVDLKDKIDSLHGQEFILTLEIGSPDNV